MNTVRLARPGRLAGAGVFFFSFAVYLMTVAPGVTFWDSGELILGALTLGIPHPPAYPLFCMAGKGFFFLPLGNAAYRVNLLSAAFGAGAAWLVYLLVLRMCGGASARVPLAVSAALGLAFFPSYWGVSVVSEVYTLNAFLVAGALMCLHAYSNGGADRHLLASSFIVGLALVNHQSTLMFLPPYAVFCLMSGDNFKKPLLIAQTAFFFLLGYSAVLYIPVRSAAGTLFQLGDPTTLGGFGWVIKWPENVDTIRALAGAASPLKLAAMGAAAAAYMAAAYRLRKNGFMLLLAAGAFFYFAGVWELTAKAEGILKQGLHMKFYIPVLMLCLPAAAYGVSMVLGRVRTAGAAGAAVSAGLSALLVAAPVGLMARGYAGADNSRNHFAFDFATDTLRSVKEDAVLFGLGDNGVFPVWYIQRFERYRDDVFFMHTELLSYPWYMEEKVRGLREKYGVRFKPAYRLTEVEKNVPDMARAAVAVAPVYFDFSAVYRIGLPWEDVTPQGLVHAFPPTAALPQGRIWDKVTARSSLDKKANRAFAVEGVLDIYAYQCYRWGVVACSAGMINEANEAFELCETLSPGKYKRDCLAPGKVVKMRP